MTHGGSNAKARRLQVRVAEDLSRALGLTIEAEPPTRPGERNGATWVVEGSGADLRVRRMGAAGDDVALLTKQASARVRWPGGAPLQIECKCTEAISLDAVWKGDRRSCAPLAAALAQLRKRHPEWGQSEPVVVFSKNRWPVLALLARYPGEFVVGVFRSPPVSPRLWVPDLGTIVLWSWLVEGMRKEAQR